MDGKKGEFWGSSACSKLVQKYLRRGIRYGLLRTLAQAGEARRKEPRAVEGLQESSKASKFQREDIAGLQEARSIQPPRQH